LVVFAVTALPLWGAVDATLRRSADWSRVGRSRTRWVAVQGIGAPFGVGFLASLVYFAKIRGEVEGAAAGANEVLVPAAEVPPAGQPV
jgi:hypothetical protein